MSKVLSLSEMVVCLALMGNSRAPLYQNALTDIANKMADEIAQGLSVCRNQAVIGDPHSNEGVVFTPSFAGQDCPAPLDRFDPDEWDDAPDGKAWRSGEENPVLMAEAVAKGWWPYDGEWRKTGPMTPGPIPVAKSAEEAIAIDNGNTTVSVENFLDVDVIDIASLDDDNAKHYGQPWIVLFVDGQHLEFPSEDSACAFQAEWRRQHNHHPMTGEASAS